MLLSKLGKYKVVSWLGGGGFGDVYLAEDTLLGKRFAIKVARACGNQYGFLKREAGVLASLDHPNIARFYNLDLIDGRLVLVMEYVEGKSLRALLEEKGRLEIEEIGELFFPILDALEYAHSKGVFHRDIKPENILISHSGTVKLVDFGLGLFVKGKSFKSTGLAGTPIYMAPEAWKGAFLPASDIYSLAVVIYESITGRNPFEGETLEEIRRKVFEGEVKPIRFYLPSLPEELDKVLGKALSKKAESRYLKASVFKEELAVALRCGKLHALSFPRERAFPSEELNLTPIQREIVFSPEKRILLVGGAGTGKTTTLLYRLYRRLRDGVDSSLFLVLSFTRRAVDDLKKRLALLLGRDLRDIWIETFHGASYKILRRESDIFGFSPDFSVEPSTFPLLKEVAGKSMLPAQVARAWEEITLLRANLVSPEEFLEKASSEWGKKVAELYLRFTEEKRKRNLMDFDDLIFYTVKVLEEEKDIRKAYLDRFKYIFVDELQDLNEAQYRLVKLLTSEESEIFMTGDADQAIYFWRGASPERIKRAERELSLRRFYLTHSFRLPRKVLNLALSLMSRSGRDLSEIVSFKGEGEVQLYVAKDELDEARFIIQTLKSLCSSRKLSDFAILYRHNFQSRVFEEFLMRAGIPYEVLGAVRFYEREDVRKFTSYLKGILEGDLEPVVEFLAWILGTKRSNFRVSKEGIKVAEGKFRNYRKAGKLAEFIWEVLREGNLNPERLLRVPVEMAGLLKRKELKWQGIKEAYLELLKVASSFREGELSDFLNHISLMEEMGLSRHSDAVKLLTFHSAKGLEFKVVFITGLTEGSVPPLRSLARLEELEEERRLLFVAITRASEVLYLCYPKRVGGKASEPSRFLLQLLGML